MSMPLRLYRSRIVTKVLYKLLSKLHVIVTNDVVEKRYRELGANNVWTVPNVPLKFEVNVASETSAQKKEQLTTCYVGNMREDNHSKLRNTQGIQELWRQNSLGNLLVLEGNNYVPHLKTFEILKSCHFNLLYWKPISDHKYYLQNKAFLASVVGVPTIISDSLTATINLLGDFALPVHSLMDVKETVQSDLWNNNHSFPKPSHVFEYYSPRIMEAYN